MTKLLSQLVSLLFPCKCLLCNTLTQGDTMLCTSCWSKLEFITEPKCRSCSLPFSFDLSASNLCASCLGQPPYFDSAFALLKYNKHSKVIIHKLKYADQLHIARCFAKLIVTRLSDEIAGYHIVIPVPLHRKRLLSRRYNQAAVLGSNIAKLAKLQFLANALVKKRHDVQQTKLTRDERMKNVLGSFSFEPRYKKRLLGKRVILIDDVHTTGTTLSECSRILKKSGCAEVYAITLARVIL
jgi:ComF family protein